MMMSDIPIPLDAMNLVAAVDAQAELMQLAAQLQTLQNRVSSSSARDEERTRVHGIQYGTEDR